MAGTPPLSATYLDVQNAHPTAVLELLSAWTPTPVEMACPFFDFVTLEFTYTRTGAGGMFDFRVEYSQFATDAAAAAVGAGAWAQEALYAAAGVVAGAVSASAIQHETQTYQEEGAAVESFPFGPIALNGTIERIRVLARENAGGLPLAPGTLQVQANFGHRS